MAGSAFPIWRPQPSTIEVRIFCFSPARWPGTATLNQIDETRCHQNEGRLYRSRISRAPAVPALPGDGGRSGRRNSGRAGVAIRTQMGRLSLPRLSRGRQSRVAVERGAAARTVFPGNRRGAAGPCRWTPLSSTANSSCPSRANSPSISSRCACIPPKAGCASSPRNIRRNWPSSTCWSMRGARTGRDVPWASAASPWKRCCTC
jgi:hypothetical protein